MGHSNINTPKFWDGEFTAEHKHWKNKSGFWRFNAMRFDTIASFIDRKGRALDVGCGLGHFCRYLKAVYPWLRVEGCDFSPAAVSIARKYGEADDYFVCSGYNIVRPSGAYDVVVAQEIIEHLSDVPAFLAELHRVTKPGGTIIVTTPMKQADRDVSSHDHVREFTLKELADMMDEFCEEARYTLAPIVTQADGSSIHEPTMFYVGKARKGRTA